MIPSPWGTFEFDMVEGDSYPEDDPVKQALGNLGADDNSGNRSILAPLVEGKGGKGPGKGKRTGTCSP